MVNLKSKIYVAGHNGLVGSAIVKKLKEKGLTLYLLPQLKLAVFIQTINIKVNLFMKI